MPEETASMPHCKGRLDEWEPEVNTTLVRGSRLPAARAMRFPDATRTLSEVDNERELRRALVRGYQ